MMKIETGMRVRILAPWNGEDDPYTGRMGIVDAASPGAVFVTLDEPVHPCRLLGIPARACREPNTPDELEK
jgi:hypothetical protein